MNQRIQELKAQCYIPIVDRVGDTEYDMEKFAVLLVKECISVLDEEIALSVDRRGDNVDPDLILRKHFGIPNFGVESE
jgi:hypothetical protein